MNAVQCDYCGKFAPNPGGGTLTRSAPRLPVTWWTAHAWRGDAVEGSKLDDSDSGDFCSRECISGYFARPVMEAVA